MHHTKHAFTLVEVLIAISIVIVLASISVTSYFSQVDKSNNSLTQARLESLDKFLLVRGAQKTPLPLPSGNLTLYHEDASLSPTIEDAFSISGFFSDSTLSKQDVGFLPIDERSKQFFGFGIAQSLGTFQIAGVMIQDSAPISKVVGNHSGKIGPYNLVRHYAGGDFVPNKSRDYFPYDPEELVMHARITSMTGSIEVNGDAITQTGTELYEGDAVKTSTGGHATIYFSDGSKVVLGDASQASSFTLARLRYSSKDNLSTQIRLVLDMGHLWSRVAKLSSESAFEVGTTDAIATVRGTNFGVVKDAGQSLITLQEGKLEVAKTQDLTTFAGNPFTQSGGVLTLTGGLSYLEVAPGEAIKGIKVGSSVPTSDTGGLDHLPIDQKDNLLKGLGEINPNINLLSESFDMTGPVKFINLLLTDTLKQAKTLHITTEQSQKTFALSNTASDIKETFPFPQTLTGYVLNLNTQVGGYLEAFKESEYIEISLCGEQCTRPLVFFLDQSRKATPEDQAIMNRNDGAIECPKGYEQIFGRCVENSLSSSGYKVVGYAPLDYTLDMLVYRSENITPTFSGVTFSGGGVDRGAVVPSSPAGAYLKYDIYELGLREDFAIEMEVRGEDLKRNGEYYLFEIPSNIYLKILTSGVNQFLILGYYDGGWKNIKYYNLKNIKFSPKENYTVRVQFLSKKIEKNSVEISINDSQNNPINLGPVSSTNPLPIEVYSGELFIAGRMYDAYGDTGLVCNSEYSCSWESVISKLIIYSR